VERVLVTGATGFVGQVLCQALAQAGYVVRAGLRTPRNVPDYIRETSVVGDLNGSTDWSAALEGVDFVIHAAARAHVLNDSPDNAHQYFATNAEGTQQLALLAARAKVRRFVYLSSVKVNGEETVDHPFTADDVPRPQDPYGRSKLLGEQHLAEVAAATGLQALSVRSPLVYGPGVRANFLRLMSWVDKERPLPLGSVANRRSLVSVWNLCDLLMHGLRHPRAPGRTWMVSDGFDLSTPDLIRALAAAMGRKARLMPVPVQLLKLAGTLVGRQAEVARLCSSLVVDSSPLRAELNWQPPLSFEQGIARTVDWYVAASRQ
jgi:nucleoside-diphosphate-sugar epimerase